MDFEDGSFLLVGEPSHDRAPLVRAYHQELLNQVRQFQHYHLLEADAVLFEEFAPYYQAIANQLDPPFDVATLTPTSRQRFFIATDPICPQLDSDTWFAGLSQLEELMGFEMVIGENGGGEESIDPHLELLTGLLLFRPSEAEWMSHRFSSRQLGKILQIASELQPGEDGVSERQRKKDLEAFNQNEAAIQAQFAQTAAGAFLN